LTGAVILLDYNDMIDELSDLYQQVILDHCKHPRNFHTLGQPTCSIQGNNPLCGDQLTLFLLTDGEKIVEVSFVGSGCCISKASASLLTEAIKGKTKQEARELFNKVHEMITTGNVDSTVGKLTVFAGVHNYPSRVKCAILPWHALIAALDGKGQTVTTENEHS